MDMNSRQNETIIVFDHDVSRQWSNNPGYNEIFIRSSIGHLNELLRMRGHVFLNEVYDCLGLQRTAPGQICGWISNLCDCVDIKVRALEGADFELQIATYGIIYDKIEADLS